MPRIRTIKPDFFTSDTVSELPLRARLTWIGMWTHCDDHGRCRDNVKLIKAAVWPLDNVSLRDIEEDLDALIAKGLVFSYTAAESGKNYLQVTGWDEHQKVDRPSKSAIPAPADTPGPGPRRPQAVDNAEYGEFPQEEPHSRNTREPIASTRATVALERKGKERKGADSRVLANVPDAPDQADSEPPSKCEEHQNLRNPPACGSCKEARTMHELWQAAKRARLAASPRCQVHPSHRGQPADNCANCRSDRLAGEAA